MTLRVAGVIRVICVLAFAISAALPAAACDRYECRLTVDTAQCYIRFGPNSTRFRLGTDCQEVANCNYVYNNVWTYTCSYDCVITECYEV
jgi:hypothetical protein